MTAKNILQAGVICLLLFFGNREASAQSYLLRYVTTTYGAVTFTGNTLGLAKATGQNRPGALDSIGAFTTLNTNSIVGTGTVPGPTTYPFGTTTNWTNNSSAAVLQIPTNSTILYAELIWAGTAQITTNTSPAGDVLSDLNTPVKFILPTGTTNSITPDPATASLVTNGTSAIFYVRSADVTALVQSTGAGTYAAGGVPGIVLATEDANNACGWTLAVVYGNSTLHYRNLSLFIGNSFAISGGTPPNPAVVSGFSTPFTGTVSGRLSVSAVEGDPNKTGDQMLFGPTTNTLAVLSGPNNITNNFFASQINGDTGLLDTSGTFGLSNSVPPTVGFSARQGWDITSVDVSSELSNGLTNAYAQNITQGDGYSVNALALEIDAQPEADVALFKNGPANVQAGSNATYTITLTNLGPASASNVVTSDNLPASTSFVSASGGGTPSGNVVTWPAITNFPVGASSNFTVTVTSSGGVFTNSASSTAATTDPNPANNNGTGTSNKVITRANRPPVAVDDTASTFKNTSVTVAVLANDSDPDGDPLTIVSVSPTNGTASIVGTNVLFTPAAGFVGTATVNYTISDGNGGTASASISVSVLDHPPVANGQSVTTVQGAPKAIVLTGSDADNDTLTFVIVTPPANGVLSLLNTNTGAVTYTPNAGFAGTDSFTFLVNDGTSNSAPATVSISVTAQADVAVFKTGPASVFAGTNFTYTITVTNNGPSTATNIVVTDQLPVGFAFVSTTPATATISNNFVIWPTFNLANNTQTNFTVTVISANGGNFTNVAFATSDTPDPNPANNNGTLTNSQVFTTVTPLADVAVFKTGGTNVAPGGTVNYIITVTNSGPSTASNIVVRDTLPTGAAFQSASGSFTLSNNIVIWSGMTLAEGASVNFNVALTAPASGSFINIASSTSDTLDSNTNNNNGSSSTSQVGTTVTPVADVIVLLSAPTNILLGDSFVYSISVINNGPSPAVNVVVTDSLPVNLTFDSASAGGLLTNGIVTWPAISFLTNGGSTNFTITVTGTNAGTFTNVAFAVSSTFDPDLTNNNGTSPASQIATTVAPAMLAFIVGTQTLNPQSGLVEEPVTVTNIGTVTVDGVRLLVGNLPNGVTLYNAAGTTNGLAYAESDLPLSPGGTVKFVLEFYDHTVAPPFPNTLTVMAILPPPSPPLTSNKVPINRIFVDTRIAGDTRFVIEFNTIVGRTYTIFYSEDLVVWKAATPSITASTDVTQWYDDGPPKTESVPTTIPHRFYQVILSN